MLKLVFISAFCLGILNLNSADAAKEQDVIQEASPFYISKPSFLPKTQFHCHKRPSGYYADPRFNCQVFHFCHEDGTRVTIHCSDQDSLKHRICLLRDIASKACDGTTELYLALPQDLFFKASKDTTASALNGATDFKIPEVIPEPGEDKVSTTPLSHPEHRTKDRSSQDGSIYEVFNSFLKEIEGSSIPKNVDSKLRPTIFGRGSRVSATPNQKLEDSRAGRRLDSDDLVEIYNDEDNLDNNDYSSYSRKSKKLFPSSDKKTPGKFPRRRKRSLLEQQFRPSQPYAIIYAKVPDTTFPSSLRGLENAPGLTQERRARLTSGEVPLVPVTIETKRKKKSKSKKKKKKTQSSEQQPQVNQQTSEQQNIYFYAPEQDPNSGQLSADGRTRIDPRQRVTESRDPTLRQRDPQQGQQPQYSQPSPYPNLQIPSFPFQAQQFVNDHRQSPYYFSRPQDSYSPFGPPQYGPQQQYQQPRPQIQQSQRPQTLPQRDPNQRPTRPEPPKETTATTERPSAAQGYQRFQNPFYESFSGFGGGAPFGGPYTQREPPAFSLLPPGQAPQQPQPQRSPELLIPQPGIPQPQPQSQHVPENLRPGISVVLQPNEDPRLYTQGVAPQQDRTRPTNEDSQPQPSPQRPPRNRGRVTSDRELSHPQSSSRPRDSSQSQRSRQPAKENTPDRNPRPQLYDPNDQRIVYQPEYIPQDFILQPENPSAIPLRGGNPQGEVQDSPPRPVILLEDLTSQDRHPQNPNNPREVIYTNRQPIEERPRDEQQRRPKQNRNPHVQEDPRQPQSSRYISPTSPPPSTRTRVRDRQPPRNERPRTRPVEEIAVPVIIEENPDYGHRTSPSPDDRPVIIIVPENNREPNRYNSIPPSPPIPQRRPSDGRRPSEESRRPSSDTRPSNERRRPSNEDLRPNSEGRRPSSEGRRPSSEDRRPSSEDRRPSSEDRRPSSEDRRPSSEDRRPSSEGRRPSSEGRRPSSEGRRPSSEDRRPSSEDRRPSSEDRRPSSEDRRPSSEGRRPSSEGRRPSSEIRRPPPEVAGGHRPQTIHPSRYQSNPRENLRDGSQPQVERPPPQYIPAEPQPEIYSGPPGYYTYPPHGNEVNVISTDNGENRPHTPPSTRQQHSHRQPTSNYRSPVNNRIPELELGFIPMTKKPYYEESEYQNRQPIKEHGIEAGEEYSIPDKIQSNRYQDVNEETSTAKQVSTTRRPTQKPRPPPPKPTFPTFPTFPPPPRRPAQSPKPRTESPEFKDDSGDISRNPEHLAEVVSRSKPQIDAIVGSENLRNTDDYMRTDSPEVTTRRRTRKKKPRTRRPRPTTSYSDDSYTTLDVVTQPTTERQVVSRSTASSRQNKWQKQTTAQPRRAGVSTEETSTEAASAKNDEFGSRINLFGRQRPRNSVASKPRVATTTQQPTPSSRGSRAPTVTRTRKPLSNRVRARTTTTEYPETDGPIARSDENSEFLYYQAIDFTTESTALPEFESVTVLPLESTPESFFTTESYSDDVETTQEYATSLPEEGTTDVQDESDNMGDFESTRAVANKFQNRPRILKFGKPKLRSTTSPLVSESRAF